MRKLHPIGPHERLLSTGSWRRPDGVIEQWTAHGLPANRTVLRVEVTTDELWHLILDDEDRPERLQARVALGGRTIEATFTFYDDEVIIWRRGTTPASETIAMPPGARLLWPPFAGRARALGLPPLNTEHPPSQLDVAHIAIGESPTSALVLRPLTVAVVPRDSFEIRGAEIPAMRLEVDDAGEAIRWWEDDAVADRIPSAARVSVTIGAE